MKILTRKKQKEILAKQIANVLIFRHAMATSNMPGEERVECLDYFIQNTCDVIYTTSGINGIITAKGELEKL